MIKPLELSEREAYVLTLMLQDIHNGEAEFSEGTEPDEEVTRTIEQKLYDAGVESELTYEKGGKQR